MENGKEIQRMRTLVIERLEGIYAICRDRDAKPRKNAKEQKFFAILLSELPESAAAGDTIRIDDEAGTLSLAKAELRSPNRRDDFPESGRRA